MSSMVKVGDTVMWRGSFGTAKPIPAVVCGIEINTHGGKDGDPVESAPWSAMRRDNAIISLENHHWCYGDAISALDKSLSLV